jgi:EAL domain-containing protein (putative c-di-GMP-specific phosphodiesterase class I)
MQLKQETPWIVLIGACAFTAIAVAAYGLGAGLISVTLASVSLIALAAGIVVLLARNLMLAQTVAQISENNNWLAGEISGLVKEQITQQRGKQALQEDVAALRQENQGMTAGLTHTLGELRDHNATLAEGLKTLIENNRQAEQRRNWQEQQVAQQSHQPPQAMGWQQAAETLLPPTPVAAAPITVQPAALPRLQAPVVEPSATPEADVPFGDALNLALEPIVDLYTSQTAHYRMTLGMTNEHGMDVQQDIFLHHAERIGMREALDMFVVRETLSILERLRQRDPALCILVPLGSTTLGNREALQKVLQSLQEKPELASGVVLEIPHAVLASLPDRSLEGLAYLARAGVTLSLAQASISGVDLASLGKLNVRFIGLAAASLSFEGRLSAGLAGFVQATRALRIQVIVSQVGDPAMVAGLARTARLASGPAFAAPRRLRRHDATQPTLRAAA